MNRFWEAILLQILEAGKPKCLVEIGVDTGLLTEKLVAYASGSGAIVHAIDPDPQIDLPRWQERHGQTLVFHRVRSLDVLGDLCDADAVFIDGDHNWFTVYHELKLLEETNAEHEGRPPLVAMHDIDWPYGRRDMYYDPTAIPEQFRQPYRRAGMSPGDTGLVDEGVNGEFYNAVREGSARNGVRTALEDFIAESETEWSQTFIPGFHGLALAIPLERLRENQALEAVVGTLHSGEFLARWSRELEVARIHTEVHLVQEVGRLQRELADTERALSELGNMEPRIGGLERQLRGAKFAADTADAKINELDGKLSQARSDALAAHRWLRDLQDSASWRVTAPLRRAKRLLRGE